MAKSSSFPNLNMKSPGGIKPGGIPYNVFIVEDKDFQRKQIVQIFESDGYRVLGSAVNGQEALKKISSLEPKIDLITTNLDMPVMDGYAFVYELKELGKMPLVIFISEETTKGVMQDLISMGIADYILKPVNRLSILERTKKALNKFIK